MIATVYTNALRSTLQDGDVLVFSGRDPISLAIRAFTRPCYSHAGIVLWWNERVMAVEAVAKGVRAWPLSECVGHYDGHVELFRPKTQTAELIDRAKLRQEATGYLGKDYGFWNIARIAWHLLVDKPRAGPDRKAPPREFICSELVSRCYRNAGCDLVAGVPDGFTTPAEIARSHALEKVGPLVPSAESRARRDGEMTTPPGASDRAEG